MWLNLTKLLVFSLLISLVFGGDIRRQKPVDVRKLRSSKPEDAPASFDCAQRKLAWQYAQTLQPWRKDSLKTVFDALELKTMCGVNYTLDVAKKMLKKDSIDADKILKKIRLPSPLDGTYYVDPIHGSDSNSGSLSYPFRTLPRAVLASRGYQGYKNILLRKGIYYLEETLKLYATDSQLSISNYNGEDVEISGGIPLTTKWSPYKVSPQPVWEQHANVNNIDNRVDAPGQNTTSLKFLGLFNNVTSCMEACKNFKDKGQVCYAYTYHTVELKTNWARACYADVTQIWGPTPEANIISGRWVQYNIYVADLSGQRIQSIPGLQLESATKRIIRARYPSADTETTFFPDGWIQTTQAWSPPRSYPPAETVLVTQPSRTDFNEFQQYSIGIGGSCSIFTPPESYWCSKYNSGGGPGLFETPTGLVYNPNTFLGTTFSTNNGKGAVAQVWHPYHWASWMYQVDSINSTSREIKWTLGGFQGARGSILTGGGSQWFLENQMELLDNPNEYYYDEATQKLYYFHNSTTEPPTDLQFVATNVKNLIEVRATQEAPLEGLQITGIRFTGSAYTYLDPHGVPSGGDWGLQRMGSLFLEGTVNALISDCEFVRLDGISVMLSGYNRGTTIQKSEFSWTGDSAAAAWGYTKDLDGTDGNQPRGTHVLYNIFREIGMYEKQSSAWFQAKSCQNVIAGNIIFNGPRALINFNDGFGGGNEIYQNLLFNANRETSDQGPFNSWDRMPFLTTVGDGKTVSFTPKYNDLHHNFFICNYGSNMCIDNDDGSSYYYNHHNFEVYGGHKSDFGGHNKFTFNSINAYSKVYDDGLCNGILTDPPFVPNYVDGYYNNICIQSPAPSYTQIYACDVTKPDTLPISFNNSVYNSIGTTSVKCGNKVYTEEQWQAMGFDKGTKVYPLPTDNQVILWARELLTIPADD